MSAFKEYIGEGVYLRVQMNGEVRGLVGILSEAHPDHIVLKTRGRTYIIPTTDVREIRRAHGEVEP